MSYRTLLLDALPRADLRLVGVPESRFTPPSATCVPWEITPLIPLINDFFHRARTARDIRLLPPLAVPYPETWWEWCDDGVVGAIHVHAFEQLVIRDAFDKLKAVDGARPSDKKLEALFALGRWTLEMTRYVTLDKQMKPGGMVAVPLRSIGVLGLGGNLQKLVWGYGESIVEDPADLPAPGPRDLVGMFLGVLFAMSLLGCKNVEREDVEPPPALSRKRVRRGAKPLVRYHRLRITVPGKPGRYVDTDEVRRVAEHGVVGLHYRRGHFKEYGPERPLLGRAVGRWYWPPHLVGDVKRGVIGKEYRAVPGDPKGAP